MTDKTPAEKAAEILFTPGRVNTTKGCAAIIQAAIDEAMPKWEPIETAPKDGTVVLLCSVSEDPSYCGHCVTAGFWDEDAPNEGFNWVSLEDAKPANLAWNSNKMFDMWTTLPQPVGCQESAIEAEGWS